MKSRLVLCGLLVSMILICGYALAGKAPAVEKTVSGQVTEKQQIEELYQRILELKDSGSYDAALWSEYLEAMGVDYNEFVRRGGLV